MIDCSLGRTRHDKHTMPYRAPLQTHALDELTYFISGRGTTKINGKTLPYHPHTFAYYRAGTPHDENDPEPCEVIWSHFSFRIDGVSLSEGVFEDPHGELLSLLQKMRRISLESTDHKDALVECVLAEAIVTAARLQMHPPLNKDTPDWQSVIDYIDKNSNADVDFAALAARYHYSYDRFRHLFRSEFGTSPYTYLLKRRIEHAELLLSSTETRLTDIAYDCGFSSSSQFTNIFRKHTKKTPTEYRAAVRAAEKEEAPNGTE